jgi:hypothetical protein
MAGFEPVIAIAVAALYPSGRPSTGRLRLVTHQLWTSAVNPPRTGYEIFGLWTLRFDYEYQSDYSIAELLSFY